MVTPCSAGRHYLKGILMALPKVKYEDLPEHLPFRMVEYQHPSWTHTPQFKDILEASAEEMAIGLAEAILECKPSKHNGHGATHSHDEAIDAFKAAQDQIESNADEKAYQDLRRKIRVYQKWGGQPPRMVLYPTEQNPKEWEVLVADEEGNPTIYKAPKSLVADVMVNPSDKNAYRKNGAWRARRKRR